MTYKRSREIGETGQMESELMELINSGMLDGKDIYSMGNIVNLAEVNKVLKKHDKQITAIVDNDPSKAGKKECDGDMYSIITADEFLERRDDKTVLIIFSIRYWREMADQMLRHGFAENKDLFILEALTLEKKTDFVNRGADILSRSQEKYGEDIYLVVYFGPIGDNFLFSLYIKDYLEKKGISNAVFLGDRTAAKIIKMFSLTPYEEITRDELLSLEFFYMFSDEAKKHIKILQIWEFCFHFNRCRIRFDRRFSFMDTYRHYVYGLDENATPVAPEFKTDKKWLEKLFDDRDLPKGKTVILAPYAYSINMHPNAVFWLALAEGLTNKGYSIAMNIDTEREENFVPGAAVISYELKDSVPVLEYAGAFVGMRSGFCDVVSTASCKKAVLYPEIDMSVIDYERHRIDMEFSSFKNMGLADDVKEFEFKDTEDTEYWKELAERVLNVI